MTKIMVTKNSDKENMSSSGDTILPNTRQQQEPLQDNSTNTSSPLKVLTCLLGLTLLCNTCGLYYLYKQINQVTYYEESFVAFKNNINALVDSRTNSIISKQLANLDGKIKLTPPPIQQKTSPPLSVVNKVKKIVENDSDSKILKKEELVNKQKTKITDYEVEVEKQDDSVYHSRHKRNVGSGRREYSNNDDEDGDELSVQLQGQTGDQADKSWLQLTSYARIPYNAIQKFCSKTKASCPPGPKGPFGLQGETGLPGRQGGRGDIGLPGIEGPMGPEGMRGLSGHPGLNGRKGDLGPPGIPGLDGRDGLPGEPGLDGIPGRNGLDGIPGVDGIPGYDGRPGDDGRNGTHGRPGLRGGKGDRGPEGPRGIAGPRGRSGKNGIPGTPGDPGISTWMVNGTEAKKILIAPSIPGTQRKRKTIIVREKDNLRLKCQAAGEPTPQVEWSREDGMAIATGQWKDVSVVSSTLNLTYIRRDHNGKYRCEAYNGIPPNDFKTFDVEVHFDPYVKVNQWKVGSFDGSTASLECHIEAYPIAVTYWEDRSGNILENSEKYRIHTRHDKNIIWKSTMTLRVTKINKRDFGDYHCVAKNELSITRGLIKVHEIDPTKYVPSTGSVDGLTFGPDPPNYSELFNDLCPPPVECPECPKNSKRQESRGSLYCLRVQQFGNDTYPGFRNRTLDCELSAIGKPVYHRHTNSDYGSWLRDPLPNPNEEKTRYWTTTPDDVRHLFEYIGKEAYRTDRPTRNYTLPSPFQGNSHIMYNGSFFYQERGSTNIVKYEMATGNIKRLSVPELSLEESNYLYDGGQDFLDLNTDENGLWAIYGLPRNNNTVVMKIDPLDFKVEYSWNISLSHHKFGEMFISCGVLYGIESSTIRDTKIRFALDLYKKNILDVDLPFTNPFRNTTMLGYNPKTKEIYSWDSGNQLTYPVKYIDIGYNTPYEDRAAESKHKLQDYEYDFEIGNFK